jgi:hypothetical protein
MNVTRNGKIARLPKAVRDELNRRLSDGEPGKELVKWLNSVPEVEKVLALEFDGHPMREQNLSEWRKGGYRDWLAEQEARAMLSEMVAEGEALKTQFGQSVADKLAGWLIPHYMTAARAALTAEQNPKERWAVLRTVCNDLVALRRGDHYVERLRLEGERLEAVRQLTKEKKEMEFNEWLKRPDVQAKAHPKADREKVRRQVMQMVDHVLLGTPLEDFEYLDDEDPEPQPDPAAVI